ncbi:MAG: UDP-N-acetylmuramate--L-alanine ligase [Ginsengibacter sp.]
MLIKKSLKKFWSILSKAGTNGTLKQIMVELNNITRTYFLGIGGIGMSAIARYFNTKGVYVSGYDKTSTALTKQMETEGIHIHYEDSIELLDKETELVVYTPAIPDHHKEFMFYRQNNYTVIKRSEVLESITNSSFNICIAGTHGKTTISTMVAHILRDSAYGCTAFLGGISVNYNTNFWSNNTKVSVVEADEYDRSFLKLSPDIAVISAMDADHLDIYGTEEKMEQAFIDFSVRIKPGGLLLSKFGLNRSADMKASEHFTYSLQNESAYAYAANIRMMHGAYQFDVITKSWMIDNIILNIGGMHNVENAVAATIIAHHLKIENNKIREAIKNFAGVKRRFEYILHPSPPGEKGGDEGNIIFIDDYAHHPEELKALISSAKSLFNGLKCTVVFQPHLFSRTRDLAEEFAKSLDLADEVILLPIYPARELPVAGVSSDLILTKMRNRHKQILTKEQLLQWVQVSAHEKNQGSVFITAGAGDIDTLVEPIKNILTLKQR